MALVLMPTEGVTVQKTTITYISPPGDQHPSSCIILGIFRGGKKAMWSDNERLLLCLSFPMAVSLWPKSDQGFQVCFSALLLPPFSPTNIQLPSLLLQLTSPESLRKLFSRASDHWWWWWQRKRHNVCVCGRGRTFPERNVFGTSFNGVRKIGFFDFGKL